MFDIEADTESDAETEAWTSADDESLCLEGKVTAIEATKLTD